MVRNGISFRTATSADVAAMVQCHLNEGPADTRMAAYFEGQHHPQQALPARTGYVAFMDAQLIGYIAGHRTKRHGCEGEVQYLFVSPAYRLRGIGTALLQRLAQWFAQKAPLISSHNRAVRSRRRRSAVTDEAKPNETPCSVTGT